MASNELFSKLADALGQPSKTFKAAKAAIELPGQALGGYEEIQKHREDEAARKAKIFEAVGTVADHLGTNKALQLFGPTLKANGIDPSSFTRTSTTQGNQTQDLGAQYAAGDIGGKELDRGLKIDTAKNQFEQNRPRRVNEVRANLLQSGATPQEADSWLSTNTNPDGTVSNRNYADFIQARSAKATGQRGDFFEGSLDVKRKQLQNAVLNTAMRYSGAGAAQHASADAISRLSNLERAKAIVGQIQSQNGQATIRQRTELGSAVGRSLNPTGVLTNEALLLYIPTSLRGKVGNFQEYLTNASYPVDFTGFLPELSDTLNRETQVNQDLIDYSTRFGKPAVDQLRGVNPGLADSVNNSRTNNPMLQSPDDAAALKWLADNPNAPEAPAIRAKLNSKGQR